MKRIYLFLTLFILSSSCNKNHAEKEVITKDLKNLSLTELKDFLDGKWSLHRSELYTISGLNIVTVPDSARVYLIFHPIDSIRRENTVNSIVIREKLIYEYLRLPGMGSISSYVLKFDSDVYGYRNLWVADRLVNDTLVFANYFRSEGNDQYYYTKEH